ncbi:polysaccharide ABC transporter ATP-binding protein [Salipaludibacillus neizhouensis]|uniref:Polysaccharide ABC transporter ATP-binding protein n=1 Tax=Salipaludibacillus neizhouensis TaxID=885475 RepID=A0A3A9JY94_9BACI|nr:ABC transporter permease subunit [Salipaludibacillus neizhouensis]RKL65169.1 polysaccharide ABC transporter ATP-binding protein [Salipaludibacillus neizhouensis]
MKLKEELRQKNESASLKKETSKKSWYFHIRRDWQLYVLLLIPVSFAFVFKYVPLTGILVAFKDYNIIKGFWASEWVGLDVFRDLFARPDFLKAVRNTLLLNVSDLVLSFTIPIFLALLINEINGNIFKRVNQTLIYLPHFLSWVIMGALAYQLLGYGSGMVNNLIEQLGGNRIPFLQSDIHWLFSYLAIGVWQGMGWGTIIYLAAMSGVNPELYEAATVDGANRWRKMWHVTIPCIRPTIVILVILSLGHVMGGSFERVYALQNMATTEFTTTIPVLVFRWGIENGDYSSATALGVFQAVIGLVLVVLADQIAKKAGEDGLL